MKTLIKGQGLLSSATQLFVPWIRSWAALAAAQRRPLECLELHDQVRSLATASPGVQEPAASSPSTEQERPSKRRSASASDSASASTSASHSPSSPKPKPIASESPAALYQSHTDTSYEAMTTFSQSRYSVAYREILYREMMLKTSPGRWTSVPRLKSITLTINAATDTHQASSTLPLQDLLLHQLALEMIAVKPADFIMPKGQLHSGKAEGVSVTLHGDAMMNFLEKLIYMVLPNQIGFEGAAPCKEVPSTKLPRPGTQPIVRTKPKHTYFSQFKVTNLMLFPDFEQNFELFEQLRSMQVRLDVEDASSPHVADLLLSALALPVNTAMTNAEPTQSPNDANRKRHRAPA